MEAGWQGHYLDGKSAASRKAEVRILRSGLQVVLEDGRYLFWDYGVTRQTQGFYTGEPVRLERGSGIPEVLVVDDVEFLKALRESAGDLRRRFHDPGSRRTRLWLTVGAGLASLVVAFTAYQWGIPALSAYAAARVPVSWEVSLGEAMLGQLAPPEKRLHDPALDRALRRIMARLTATLPENPYEFKVTVCDLPVMNAFALPGGNIVVFRGLLERTRTPEELAGVLAHEMQHILKRHSTQRIIQDSSTGILLSALSGDVTGSVTFGLKGARTLALLQYGREEESESDREGMRMILAAGIDPKGMVAFFKTLQKHAGDVPEYLKYLSTHPATGERVRELERLAVTGKRKKGAELEGTVYLSKKALRPGEELVPGIHWPALVKGLRQGK